MATPKNLKTGESTAVDPQAAATAMAPLSVDQKQLKHLIERRHPEYNEKKEHWDFLEDTYEGGREWFEDNIFRYLKEGEEEYAARVKRAYRFNHTREVVDLINKYLFRQNITRNEEDAPESVKQFWKKATKNGLSIKEFAKQIAKATSIGGRVGIVVDNPATVTPENRAEEKRAEIYPYAYIVGPEQLLDYAFDERGELEWILILEAKRDDSNPLISSGKVEHVYRLWTRQDWRLFGITKDKSGKETVVELSQGYHGLNVVPVILADHILSDEPYCASAMIDDIAYLDRAVANYLSNLDAIVQDQTFSQLAMPAQNLLPGEEGSAKVKEMGTKRVFLYDGESGGKPEFLTPDVKQAELIVDVVTKIIGEIYHSIGLAGERTKQDNAMGIDNSSGVAKAYDFERVNALLAAKADSLESIENRVLRLVALWKGDEKTVDRLERPLVVYPDNFDTRSLYDEFDIAARLMLISAPEGTRREQMQMVIDKLFPGASRKTRKELEKELEDWPVDPVADAQEGVDATDSGDKAASNAVSNQKRTAEKSANKNPADPGQGSVQ